MANVAALYRYPVKGFTPESPESLTVTSGGRIAGDRVLGFRFADTPEADDEWSRKFGMVVLVNTPGIARLHVNFDDEAMRLKISLDDRVIADEALDVAGRKRLCDVIADYVGDMDEGPLKGHPEHLPLRLIGDGHTARYQDRPDGYVTMHGRSSVAALGEALGAPDLNEVRFRSNVSIEGLEPFEELSWMERTLHIGDVQFRVHIPIGRCLATHANPVTGERDQPVLTTLTKSIGLAEPQLAVALVPLGPGEIHVGDELRLDD